MDGRGRAGSGAYGGFTLQENHQEPPGIGMCWQGSPPRPRRSQGWDRVKERFGKRHIKENVWKIRHFRPNSLQLPPHPGRTWKAKTETRKGKIQNLLRECQGQPGPAPAWNGLSRPEKWNQDKIRGWSRSVPSPGTPGIPGPAQYLGLGLGLD